MAQAQTRNREAISSTDRSVALATGAMLLLGAGFVTLAAGLPHPQGGDVLAQVGIGAAMAIAGGLTRSLAGRVPLAASHALLAWAALSVGALMVAAGSVSGGYAAIFFWELLIAAYFFPRRVAAVHLAWILVVYAVALGGVEVSGGYSPLTRWVSLAVSLTVVMLLTTEIVRRRARADTRARRFFDISQDMLSTMDEEGRCVEVNGAWLDCLGYSPEEMQGRPLLDITHPDDLAHAAGEAGRVIRGEPVAGLETRVRARDGSWHWLRSAATYAPDERLVYARSTDVTELKKVEAEREHLLRQVEQLALTDSLTGLPNRRSLDEALRRETARALRDGSRFAVAILDLDEFKAYNDAHGHPVGDELLRECAIAWDSELRAGDTICRFGGEEFVVVLPGCRSESAGPIVERLRAVTPRNQTVSAGLAVWDGTETPESLVSRADGALYRAKSGGRDRLVPA